MSPPRIELAPAAMRRPQLRASRTLSQRAIHATTKPPRMSAPAAIRFGDELLDALRRDAEARSSVAPAKNWNRHQLARHSRGRRAAAGGSA